MAFVYQHQIAGLESIHSDRLVAHVVGQLVDVDNLHRLAGKQTASVLVEQLGLDASRCELNQVLIAQTLVGGQQQNSVQLAAASHLGQVVLVLTHIHMHKQGLTAARRAPKR